MHQLQRLIICALALNLLTDALCHSLPETLQSGRALSRRKRQYGDMTVNQHLGDNWLKNYPRGCKKLGCGISIGNIGRRKRGMVRVGGGGSTERELALNAEDTDELLHRILARLQAST